VKTIIFVIIGLFTVCNFFFFLFFFLLADFTAALWFLGSESASSWRWLLCLSCSIVGANSLLITTNANNVRVSIAVAPSFIDICNGTAIVSSSQFHHLIVTRSLSIVNVYLDGALLCSGSSSLPIGVSGQLFIGRGIRSTDFFTGSFGEIGLWQRGISSTEVQSLFNFNNNNNITPCMNIDTTTQQCTYVHGIQAGC
jgi:hypothetical protein